MGIQVNLTSHRQEVLSAKDAGVQKALEMIGTQCVNYATLLCPVDTGRLSGSISHRVSGLSAVIGTPVEYGKYVEMGTSKMAAQPYLRPAVENHVAEYERMVETCLKGA